MTQLEILKELKRLPISEQLRVVEATLHDLHLEIEDTTPRLVRAAQELRGDYCEDAELTAFTSLDSEPFHA